MNVYIFCRTYAGIRLSVVTSMPENSRHMCRVTKCSNTRLFVICCTSLKLQSEMNTKPNWEEQKLNQEIT